MSDKEKLEWIRSQILPEEPPAAAASRLNTPALVDNPTAQQKIPAPLSLDDLLSKIPEQEAFDVVETVTWTRIEAAIDKGNQSAVSRYIRVLRGGGKISPETEKEIATLLSETMPDPNWQPHVMMSPAQIAGHSLIYTDEVLAVSG